MSSVAMQNEGKQAWQQSFEPDKANLADTGRNMYFILEPGFRLYFEHGQDTLTISVLDETKAVDGITTRIVEERETKSGQLSEVSRNYSAIDRTNNDAHYFGEDVDIYRNGKAIGHGGAWLAGVKGTRFGLMMPGRPIVGDKYYQEIASKVAMDCAG
jgi:hypothetical protein